MPSRSRLSGAGNSQKRHGKVTGRTRGPYNLGGCLPCRQKHVKCDQARPVCATCQACGIVCEGFAEDLQWLTVSSTGEVEPGQESAKGSRRHIFSEESRASMAASLVASMPSISVDSALLEIELRSKKCSPSHCRASMIGPFGLFSSEPARISSLLPLGQRGAKDGTNTRTDSTDFPPLDSSIHLDSVPNVAFDHDSISNWDDHLGWVGLLGLDWEFAGLPEFSFPDTVMPPARISPRLNSIGGEPTQTNALPTIPTVDSLEMEQTQMPALTLQLCPSDLQSGEIHLLLQTYGSKMLCYMNSVPVAKKSAWGPINHELAVHTLAEVSFLDKTDIKEANLANLYAVLSIAAYYLGVVGNEPQQSPQYWLELSQRLSDLAKMHLRRSLEIEMTGPKPAKYKEQLTATQTLLAQAWVAGDQQGARQYIIEAESLMRLRGLAKRDVSPRVRLLHHAYTWTRIIGESSYVLHDYQSFQCAALDEGKMLFTMKDASLTKESVYNPDSLEDTNVDDFLRMRQSLWGTNVELEGEKDIQASFEDIHLEDPRSCAEDGFHFIYGIPEKWLSLLSRTTRLANWIDATQSPGKKINSQLWETLQSRANMLEGAICAFVGRPSQVSGDALNRSPGECMLRCLTSALLIFFYRRIRNVHPLMLQPYVDEVIDGLEEFDGALAREGHPGPGCPWAAFMAGCEAMSKAQRERLEAWLDRAFAKCGFKPYHVAKELMLAVWEQVDEGYRVGETAACRASWMQVSRKLGIWVTLY